MHRILKKQIHKNRYFIWSLVIILLTGFVLSAYIAVSNYKEDYNASFSPVAHKKAYTNLLDGYTAFYPDTWQIEKDDATGAVIFENPQNAAESISVSVVDMAAEMEIAKSITDGKTQGYQIDNGILVIIESPKQDAAFIQTKNKILYLHGSSPDFKSFALNVKVY